MTYHKNWFNEMHASKRPGYVETSDHTLHPIEHVEKIPLSMHDGKTNHMVDVLHVPTITKNLIFVGQMVGSGIASQIHTCKTLC